MILELIQRVLVAFWTSFAVASVVLFFCSRRIKARDRKHNKWFHRELDRLDEE